MTQLYPWPPRFLSFGKKYPEPNHETKKNKVRGSSRKMKKLGARSSSRMIRMISQKIKVVKSDILIARKLKDTLSSSDMFTPIVSSFNTTPRLLVSRSFRPNVIDLKRFPKKNSSLDSRLQPIHVPVRQVKRFGCTKKIDQKNFLLPRIPSRKPKENLQKASKEIRRPVSAPTKLKNNMRPTENINANQKVLKTASSAMKPLAFSQTLFNMEMKYSSIPKTKKLRKSSKKNNKRQVNSSICVEGFHDTFSLNGGSSQDINPQLFGSLTSTSSYTPKFTENQYLCRKMRQKRWGKNTSKKNNSKLRNVNKKIQPLVPEIPEESLTRLKRPFNQLLQKNSAISKNRNLFCETNVILEENLEAENIDDGQDGINEDGGQDSAKNKEVPEKKKSKKHSKQKKGEFIDEEKRGDLISSLQRKILELLNTENSSTSSQPSSRKKRRTKIVHYIEQNSKIENMDKSTNSITNGRSVKKRNRKLHQDDALQQFLLELLGDIDSSHSNYYKQFRKALRRSFFTVSQDNSSIYETCNTHFSGDDLLMEDGRKPPPPTPTNNEDLCVEEKDNSDSRTNVEENISSFQDTVDNSIPSYFNACSEDTSMCKGMATEVLGESATLTRISGNMSSEEKSDKIVPIRKLSTKNVEKEFKGGKDNFVEHICEIDESKCRTAEKNIISFHHKVQKIPSISDTYIYESFPYIGLDCNKKNNFIGSKFQSNTDKDIDTSLEEGELSGRSKQSRKSKSRWRSAPTLSGPSNFETCNSILFNKIKSKRSNNVSSTSNNSVSINSNMEICSEKKDDTLVFAPSIVSNSPGELHKERSWCSSDISSLSSMLTNLHKKSALDGNIKCQKIDVCGSSDNLTLTDILKDLSELDHDDILKKIIGRSSKGNSSQESLKKEKQSRTSEKDVDCLEKSDVVAIPDIKICSSKIELRSSDICASAGFLSYHLSKESFSENLEKPLPEITKIN